MITDAAFVRPAGVIVLAAKAGKNFLLARYPSLREWKLPRNGPELLIAQFYFCPIWLFPRLAPTGALAVSNGLIVMCYELRFKN